MRTAPTPLAPVADPIIAPGSCFVCLGDRIDPATGQDCKRCNATGLDPDPAASRAGT